VLFQAWSGKQYSCNPRAIYEQMRSEGRDERLVWARRDTSISVPDGVRSVLVGSREYYECLATSRYLVANDSMPPYYAKRDGAQYLQTWHGTPLKRIGFDIETANFANVNYLEDFAEEKDKWSYLISPNRYSTEIFRRAFAYDGTVLETGYPRNDVFYSADVAARRDQVRARLGLPPDQRVILWAPTWRDDQRDARGRYGVQLPFDLSAWDTVLGPDDILLFRGHQLIQEAIGGMLAAARRVRNVTMYPDIQDLYLASDVLITDYSSVMYDFANTRRPMIFFAWDIEAYRDNLRGFYVDYDAEVPGPIVTDRAGLEHALRNPAWSEAESAQRYDAFLERYCSLEDGHAAERVVRVLLDR
jgi:CDP-glycerol glycerophosphotransferase